MSPFQRVILVDSNTPKVPDGMILENPSTCNTVNPASVYTGNDDAFVEYSNFNKDRTATDCDGAFKYSVSGPVCVTVLPVVPRMAFGSVVVVITSRSLPNTGGNVTTVDE